MMPWMVPYLRFSDDSLKSTFQEQLSLMRKNRLFCDVILHVSITVDDEAMKNFSSSFIISGKCLTHDFVVELG